MMLASPAGRAAPPSSLRAAPRARAGVEAPAGRGRPCGVAAASLAGLAFGPLQRRRRLRRRAEGPGRAGSAELIDGKAIAAEVRSEVRARVEELRSAHGLTPGLAVILVGSRPDSASYVRSKTKAAEEVGIDVFDHRFTEEVSEEELLQCIRELNADGKIHGILLQLPLPPGMDERRALGAIDVRKDVDGLLPYNIGCLAQSGVKPCAVPCTAAGCMELLRRSGIDVAGKDCLVLGRSSIVGMPMALLLIQANATVKVCHSHSRDVADACAGADVVIAAVGQPGFVKGDWLKEGSVVIDVGINRVADSTAKRGYRLVGDVDFASACLRASRITPVPGGVGPMTVAMLLNNTVDLAFQSALAGQLS